MKRLFAFSVFVAFLMTVLTGLAAVAQTSYAFTDLGTMGGTLPSFGLGINNVGQVMVQAPIAPGAGRIFRITPTIDAGGHQVWYQDSNSNGINDLLQMLALPSGFTTCYSYAGAINASGMVTCVANAVSGGTPQAAVVWSAGGIPAVLTTGKQNSSALGLNDGGDVAGGAWLGSKSSTPYLWEYIGGSYSSVPLSTSSGYANTVNNLRQAVGPNFLWLPSAAYGLPKGMNILSGISIGAGKNINNAGIISGSTQSHHLCLWTPPGGAPAYGLSGGMNDMGSGSWAFIYPTGLNNPPAGQPLKVVGNAQDALGNQYAIVWDSLNRTIADLNALTVNLPAGYVLLSANGINDLGQIVGTGSYNGVKRAFILTPQ